MKYYIRVVTGFRDDQYMIIPMQEAHKAYYLFRNPDQRGVFENGSALIGKNIQEIRPEWNKTMGWNESHHIEDEDWNDIESKGIGKKMKALLSEAQQISLLVENSPEIMKLKMGEIIEKFPKRHLVLID